MKPTPSANQTLAAAAASRLSAPGDYHYDLAREMKFYTLGIIIPVGIVANILALCVFFNSSSMRKKSTTHYLISLAFADTTILVGELLLWLNSERSKGESRLGLSFYSTNTVLCKLITYLRYSGRLWSSWLTVIITLERYLVVAFPQRVHLVSTTLKAKIIIAAEIIFSFSICVFPFFTVGVYDYRGNMGCYYLTIGLPKDFYKNWNLAVVGCGEMILPSFIVSVFTVLILIRLGRASRERRQLASVRRPCQMSREQSQQKQLTVILLAVAIAFVVLRLPYTILFYLNTQKNNIWNNIAGTWLSFYLFLFTYISYCLAVLNYVINFFLYCSCSSNIRTEFRRMCNCFYQCLPNCQRTPQRQGNVSGTENPPGTTDMELRPLAGQG